MFCSIASNSEQHMQLNTALAYSQVCGTTSNIVFSIYHTESWQDSYTYFFYLFIIILNSSQYLSEVIDFNPIIKNSSNIFL